MPLNFLSLESVEGEVYLVRSLGNGAKDEAKGIILENMIGDADSEKCVTAFAKTYKIPLIVQAENAMTLLSKGQKVVLDAKARFSLCAFKMTLPRLL